MNTTGLAIAGLATPPLFGLVAARITMWARARSFARLGVRDTLPAYARFVLPEVVRTPHELKLLDAYKAIANDE